MASIQELKQQIVDTSLKAFDIGLFAGTSGNLSVYIRESGIMLITPTNTRYETMAAEDIVEMKLDGTIIEGIHGPSSEWRMHAAIYEGCSDEYGSCFHTHSKYATGFAVLRQCIPVVLIEMLGYLGGAIPCARFAQPGSHDLGLSAVEQLQNGVTVCLLANHGVVTLGRDIAQSFLRAEYVEDAATIYHHALTAGTPFILS